MTLDLKLLDIQEFDKAFYSAMSSHNTHEEAYESVEKRYVSIVGKRRYSSFQSYRVVRNRRLKKTK